MFRISIVPLILLISFMVACTNTNEESQNTNENINNTQPIHYETDHEQKDRLNVRDKTIGEKGGYPQSDQEGVNEGDHEARYSDIFTNEEAEKLSEELKRRKDIIQAKVASTDERIIVGVMLRENTNYDVDADVIKSLEQEVKEIIPNTDKQIEVYTDDIHWDRMKNLDARLRDRETEGKVEDYIDEFFND